MPCDRGVACSCDLNTYLSKDVALLFCCQSVMFLLQTAFVIGRNVRCRGSHNYDHPDAVLLLLMLYSVQKTSASIQWW